MLEFNLYIGTGKYDKTETKTLIKSLADSVLTGYTLIETTGIWKGKREDSFIINIVEQDNIQAEIKALATVLREQLNQKCVLLTTKKIKVEFI